MTQAKICGLTRECDIDYANRLLPDYIGFVFADRSRRFVSPETAKKLKSRLDSRIKAVGVFVDAPIKTVCALAAGGLLDAIQLHGSEDGGYIRTLAKFTGVPIIQAFRVSSRDNIALASASPADCILLDNGDGGTGKTFDWSCVQNMDRPFFLAGGLTPENVPDAIRRCRPFAVDTSSGVETDGFKDFKKMRKFIETVRSI